MRNFKRKLERGLTSKELLHQAAYLVIHKGRRIKTVAKELEICHMTLHRYIKKFKADEVPSVSYKPKLVFSSEQEEELTKYVLKCSSIYFGLLPEKLRKLVYKCAVKFNIPNIPASWHKNQ